MANEVLRVDGLKELERKLRKLPDAVAGRELEQANFDGAKVLRDEMRRRAPRSDTPGGSRGHGHAADHIGVEQRSMNRFDAAANVGPPRWGWYLAFAEFGGGGSHTIKPKNANALRLPDGGFAKQVRHPGHSKQPWMRPSFDARKDDAVRTIKASLSRRIRDAAR